MSRRPPAGQRMLHLRGAYLAPGFIDLHVWGPPQVLAREAVKGGTTAFLTTLGPESPNALLERLLTFHIPHSTLNGAECLGLHLEGPFLNPARGGALPRRWMRHPTPAVLRRLGRAASGRVRLMTIAPELPGAIEAIRWCHRHGVAASLGHSDADLAQARRAIAAGARAVTHVFNGMRPLHHRQPALIDAALTDDRLIAMAIVDGAHLSRDAFRLLVRAKGVERIALVTDSIQHHDWDVVKRHGAYYLQSGTLAGSALTMMQAVHNAVAFGGLSVHEAVRMASEVPARLLKDRRRGTLRPGARADLVAFNGEFRVLLTMVNGQMVYERRTTNDGPR